MGHWLDGLLNPPTGAGGLTIEWDGATMSARGILAFSEQFLCIDDSIGNRTQVSIRHIAAGGDVIGSTEDLRLVQMRGAEDGQDVTVFAGSLHWDPSVSAGSAEISLSDTDAGALRVRHQGTTTAVFAASGAVIGDTAGIQKMLGGHRFSLRSIGSATLDTPTKDSIAWIDATGERTVTLPPASAGRTLLLPFVGDNPPTLARAGTELINGLPSSYTMTGDVNGGLTIAISDGANWVARTIKEGGGSGSTALVGDVNGDSDANVITQISGSGGEVEVIASTLNFTAGGVASIEVSGETDGAISITHDGTEVLLASSSIPTFGVDLAQTRLRGGVRLTVRSVDGAIDETTSDAICWIDATTEGSSATLPPATQGRVLFLPFVGENPATLQRAGTELINGIAADFDLDGDGTTGGFAIAVSDGTNWVARTIGAAPPAGVDPSRAINTTAPLTGGGNLTADRTIGIDPTGYVAPTRTISTTAPLTGGGSLAANLTLGINAAAYVAPTRTINTTAPLSGGGTLAGDLTITIDTSGFATSTRSINTTAPLTGGGNLSADRTLAVSDATGLAKGVLQLAGNLGGTAAAPTATGLTADNITIQNSVGTHKGIWSLSGLRIGDNTGPTEKLEVAGNILATAATGKITARNTNTSFDITTADPCLVADANIAGGNAILLGIVNAIRRGCIRWDSSGNMGSNAVGTHYWFNGLTTSTPLMNVSTTGLRIGDVTAAAQKLDIVGTGVASGDFVANNAANGKARLAGLVGSTTTHGALYLGNVTPSASNYAIASNGGNDLKINAGASGVVSLVINGSQKFAFSESNVNSIGTFTQTTQYNGGQIVTAKTAVTTNYSMGAGDYIIPVDTTAGAISITLPAVSNGRLALIKRVAGGNAITVLKGAATKIDISAGVSVLLAQTDVSQIHPYVTLFCDGTNWFIVASLWATIQTS